MHKFLVQKNGYANYLNQNKSVNRLLDLFIKYLVSKETVIN